MAAQTHFLSLYLPGIYALQDPLSVGDPAAFARLSLRRFRDGNTRATPLDRSWPLELRGSGDSIGPNRPASVNGKDIVAGSPL
jgi:hypothetical protein